MSQNEILKLPLDGQISYWVGYICLAIGRGNIREAITQIIFFYQTEAFERGQASMKKIGGKNGG